MCILIRALIFIWALTIFASPTQTPPPSLSNQTTTTTTTLFSRKNPNACPTKKYHNPTVTVWKKALTQYCDTHTPTTITSDSPLVYTFLLDTWDNKPILWIFKISIKTEVHGDQPFKYTFPLSAQLCKDKFLAMVTRDKGGGMPEVYCEVGGRGEKVFFGGKYEDVVLEGHWARAVWESRRRKGDPF